MTAVLLTALVLAACCLVLLVAILVVSALLSIADCGRFGTIFRRGLWLLSIPFLALAYGSLIERNVFKVNEVEIEFTDLPDAFDGYRIVQISDIHADSFRYRKKALGRAVSKINSLHGDLIAITGDLITKSPEEVVPLQETLSGLHAPDGVFSILGNHDYGTYMQVGKEVEAAAEANLRRIQGEMGWQLLGNSHEVIRRGADSIAVVGVENITPGNLFPSTGNLKLAEEGLGPCWRVLLSHDPAHWESEALGKGYNLTLSGHTHAFQFSVLGWCPCRYLFRQYRGLYEKGGQYLYVNIGLGETAFPARIGAAPEITLITLRRKQGA